MAESRPDAPQADGHVLVVEDDPLSRRLLRDIFATHGYRVTEAVDGAEALRAVEKEPPDVILLDVMMPEIDGLEVCRRLKGDARTAPIPVLLVTALHERADRLRGVACGANDFITKPIDTEEVLFRVRNALALKRLYDERDALLHMRETLSDMIVHDIRNPLLGIMLSAMRIEALKKPVEAVTLARAILGQAELIDRFISDLLDVSRMEQAGFKLNRTREDLRLLAEAAAREQQAQTQAKGITLVTEKPDAPCEAEVDETLLMRLLGNLLSNAIKFSPERSTVWLRVCPASGDAPCRLRVEDEGPGIPLGYRDSLFQKYACVKTKAFGVRQVGLGLLFCRLVAEAHGGIIYFEPREPHGSVFTVELP